MSIDNPFIAAKIASTMEQLANLPPPLTSKIMDAGLLIANRLISGKKLFVLGLDDLAPFAQLLCQSLLYDNHEHRPALPALCLNDLVSPLALANSNGQPIAIQRSLQALAQSGDVLLILSADKENPSIAAILDYSAARDVTNIVARTANVTGNMGNHSEDNDRHSARENLNREPLYLEYNSGNDNFTRTHEVILFILRCLSDIIDQQLFGDHNIAG